MRASTVDELLANLAELSQNPPKGYKLPTKANGEDIYLLSLNTDGTGMIFASPNRIEPITGLFDAAKSRPIGLYTESNEPVKGSKGSKNAAQPPLPEPVPAPVIPVTPPVRGIPATAALRKSLLNNNALPPKSNIFDFSSTRLTNRIVEIIGLRAPTLRTIVLMQEKHILMNKGVGQDTVDELSDLLALYGLRLGMTPKDIDIYIETGK